MKKRSDREAARSNVVPSAEDLVHTAVDRVGPLLEAATERLTPLAQSAAGRMSPYAQQAADRWGPLAETARQRGTQAAHDAAERFGPVLDDALVRVGPAVESARGRVAEQLLPRLSDALSAAAASPLAVEAMSRGQATLAAARGDLVLPVVEEKKKGSWLKRLAVVGAVAGVAVLVARRFLGSKDSEWQAARPTTPYTPSTAPASTMPAPPSENGSQPAEPEATPEDLSTGPAEVVSTVPVEVVGAVATDDPQGGASAHAEYVEANGQAEPEQPAEGGEPTLVGGSGYVGDEPPEGFVIKGNERSMKYHLPASDGYVRTMADVWFDSEEAAQAAGFSPAQA